MLGLIANVLGFDDEKKVSVGLKAPPENLLSSLFNSMRSQNSSNILSQANSSNEVGVFQEKTILYILFKSFYFLFY